MPRITSIRAVMALALVPVVAAGLTGCANPIELVDELTATPTVEQARSGLGSSARSASAALPVHEAGVLTVGVQAQAGAPLCITEASGTEMGYDVDVAYALADQLGLAARIVMLDGTDAQAQDACDVIMDSTADSAAGMTVAGSYAEKACAFFCKGAAPAATSASLDGAVVGVQLGSLSEQLLKRSNLSATEQGFSNINEAFEALEAGSVDFVLCDALSGAYLQADYDGVSFVGTIDVPSRVGVAVDANEAELQAAVQQAMDAISANGVVEVIRGKWLGGLEVLSDSSQIQGVTLSSSSAGSSAQQSVQGDDVLSSEVATGAQDGSTAGANAASIVG